MKMRIFLTVLLLVVWITSANVYNVYQGQVEGQIAVYQLESDTNYALNRAIQEYGIKNGMHIMATLFLIFLWYSPIKKGLTASSSQDDAKK